MCPFDSLTSYCFVLGLFAGKRAVAPNEGRIDQKSTFVDGVCVRNPIQLAYCHTDSLQSAISGTCIWFFPGDNENLTLKYESRHSIFHKSACADQSSLST